MKEQLFAGGSRIQAGKIELGEAVQIGSNVDIVVRGEFSLGDYSRLGNNVSIRGAQVSIGSHFFHTDGLVVGGGGSQFYDAVLRIGDRCVMHNNYINICQPVTIGNDVGLSPDCQIVTHGFWKSILEGFPVRYSSVKINDGVIVGQRSMILAGVIIAKDVVIGAQSVVSKSLSQERAIYAGNPAVFIRLISVRTEAEQRIILNDVIRTYREFITHYYPAPEVKINFPYLHVNWSTTLNTFRINVLTGESVGTEDTQTDDLRDFLRRYGIRIYTSRPFGTTV